MNYRYLIYLFLIFIFCSNILIPVSASAETKLDTDELVEKQGKSIDKLAKKLEKLDMSFSDLNSVGDFYFDSKGKIVLQLDNTTEDKIRWKTLVTIAAELQSTDPNYFVAEDVQHSFEELVEIQNGFSEQATKINLTNNYVLSTDSKNNRVVLTVKEILEEQKNELNNFYGEALHIIVDSEYEYGRNTAETFKYRTSNFNSLGAGIGISYDAWSVEVHDIRRYTCSTAGVAVKGSEFWVMSAGHCNDNILTPFSQYSRTLGTTHLDATASDYDFLLIKVEGSEISRYASNGLYSVSADTSTGYDSSLTGSFEQKDGLKVCKVGVTTDRTCGVVQTARYKEGFGLGLVLTKVVGDGGVLSGGGDSGGAWYTQSLPYRLVGIHQGGNSDIFVGNDTYHSSESVFTPWVEVAERYNLNLYTSSTPQRIN